MACSTASFVSDAVQLLVVLTQNNFMNGQATENASRDYIRDVVLFAI